MTPKRPLGPVYRPGWDEHDDDRGETPMSETIALSARWAYLQDGATLGAMLVHAAREGTLESLAVAVHTLDPEQLEAAVFALVLVHAEGASIVDESGPS